MSSTGKWTIGVVIVLIIAGGVWWWYSSQMQTVVPAGSSNPTTGQSQGNVPPSAPQSSLPTSPTDTSDAAINQDTAAIDAQMQGLNSDSANVTSGINDQPIPQQ